MKNYHIFVDSGDFAGKDFLVDQLVIEIREWFGGIRNVLRIDEPKHIRKSQYVSDVLDGKIEFDRDKWVQETSRIRNNLYKKLEDDFEDYVFVHNRSYMTDVVMHKIGTDIDFGVQEESYLRCPGYHIVLVIDEDQAKQRLESKREVDSLDPKTPKDVVENTMEYWYTYAEYANRLLFDVFNSEKDGFKKIYNKVCDYLNRCLHRSLTFKYKNLGGFWNLKRILYRSQAYHKYPTKNIMKADDLKKLALKGGVIVNGEIIKNLNEKLMKGDAVITIIDMLD